MSSKERTLPCSPPVSSNVFDLANLNLDPLERLRQLDCFGREETNYFQRYQESVLAVASTFVPFNHPFLESIKFAPFRPSNMDTMMSEQPNQHNADIEMIGYLTELAAPSHNEQHPPPTINPLTLRNWPQSSASNQAPGAVAMPLLDWPESNPSASHSSSGNESLSFTNISDPLTIFSNSGGTAGLGAVPLALQRLIDRTLVGDLKKHLSPSEIQARALDTRKTPPWTNYDRDLIIKSLYGPTRVVSSDSTIQVDTPFSVRDKTSDLSADWHTISQSAFEGKRRPQPIAQRYGKMFKTFCHLFLMFADHEESLPLSIFLQRVYGAISASRDGTVTDVPATAEELLAFIEGGEASWLAIMYCNLYDNAKMQRICAKLRNKTITAKSGSILSSSSRSTRPPHMATPVFSALQLPPNNQNQSFDADSNTEDDNGGPPVDRNINAVADLLRDHHVITAANLEEAKSRAAYLLRIADVLRWDLIEKMQTHRQKELDARYEKCMKVLENNALDEEVKQDAKQFIRAYIRDELGHIDFVALIKELRADLPKLKDITNVFSYAPELDPRNAAALRENAAALSAASASATVPVNAPAVFAPAAGL